MSAFGSHAQGGSGAPQGVRVGIQDLIALRGQARRLDLSPRGRVLATRSGGHLSRFRGRGMEFDESRQYQPGDDPRNMDWRVTARAGVPHVKLFREERERPVWLLVDQGPGMRFGTRVAFKSVIAAQAAALLGWAASDRGDRVGGLVFDESSRLERRPAARGTGLLPLLDRLAADADAEAMASPGGHASLAEAAGHLVRLVRPGSLVVVISDFADLDEEGTRWATQITAGSELILVHVQDVIESSVPPPGRYPVWTERERGVLDLTSAAVRRAYEAHFNRHHELMEGLARRERAHLIRLTTPDPVGPTLALALGTGRASAAGRGRG
ncbi:DUF58 domain-containing protein [Imhoffiella purpurea]|uniref:DUF58 domain-containing protein n=1 Tax=Imhoffiella purpurea TaxID=1249627 RepID=W9VEE9_9GAMM|nr:DUF58 domain-containing protein [Imhoffiella purpurea]EXJ15351.1 hypothetical protein D779_1447 [Imhoffiella purpurea]